MALSFSTSPLGESSNVSTSRSMLLLLEEFVGRRLHLFPRLLGEELAVVLALEGRFAFGFFRLLLRRVLRDGGRGVRRTQRLHRAPIDEPFHFREIDEDAERLGVDGPALRDADQFALDR